MVIKFKTYFKLVEFAERLIEAKFPTFNRILESAERRSKIKKNILVHVLVIVVSTFCIVNYLGAALRYITGYLYPAYCTLNAMNKKKQDQMNHWLKYWAVYGFLQAVETFFDHFFGFLPLYHLIKVIPISCLLRST